MISRFKKIFLFLTFSCLSIISYAQPPCPVPPCNGGNGNGNGGGGGNGNGNGNCPACIPIDQGVLALLIVGAIYGAKVINSKKLLR